MIRFSASTLALLLLAGCLFGPPSGRDGFYTVAGGQVDLWCDGGEGPTVMFISAIGGDHSLVPIAEQLAEEAYVCFYDRPGDGETEPPDTRRTAGDDAADLHELVDVADIPTPMVLVAHSYGGLISVIAAAEHPEEVAGVVLVDASHPEQETALDVALTHEQRVAIDEEDRRNFPYIDWYGSLLDAAGAYRDFPDVPLTVITATRGWANCGDGLPCDELQEIWIRVQESYTLLAPDTRHVLADTGHYVHDDEPELVVAEIQALLQRVEQN